MKGRRLLQAREAVPGTLNTAAAEEYDSARCCHQHQEGFGYNSSRVNLGHIVNKQYLFSALFLTAKIHLSPIALINKHFLILL